MKILFIVPYPIGEAPSQRFRFEQYFKFLEISGIKYDIAPFLNKEGFDVLYKPGLVIEKILHISKGFLNRVVTLFQLKKYDFIFLHREAAPLGPPLFEWFISKVAKKKIIYDFDDAIWLENVSASNKSLSKLKWYSKVKNICTWSYKISCGNEYLFNYALEFNTSVILNPTTIDTETHHNKIKNQNSEKIVIGWTGTHSTIPYLYPLIPILQELEDKYNFEFQVISNKRPDFNLNSLKYIPWKKDSEIEDLLKFNIGVMPLTDDVWARGKCGFKALQYMALGIPAVVSPVGVNVKIVDHEINGFLCSTRLDWKNAISLLMDNKFRAQLGKKARIKIQSEYSVLSNKERFLKLFT